MILLQGTWRRITHTGVVTCYICIEEWGRKEIRADQFSPDITLCFGNGAKNMRERVGNDASKFRQTAHSFHGEGFTCPCLTIGKDRTCRIDGEIYTLNPGLQQSLGKLVMHEQTDHYILLRQIPQWVWLLHCTHLLACTSLQRSCQR